MMNEILLKWYWKQQKIASTTPWKFDEEKLKHQKNLNSIIAYVLMKEHIGTLV